LKLTFRLSAFPIARFATPLIQLEATARAALLGRLGGSRTVSATAAASSTELEPSSRPADRST